MSHRSFSGILMMLAASALTFLPIHAAFANHFTIYTLDQTGTSVGTNTSVAVNSSGSEYMSYYQGTTSDLKYVKRGSTPITIESFGSVGKYSDIALDGLAKAYISYFNSSTGKVKLARQLGNTNGNCGPSNTWSCVDIDTAGSFGGRTSLTLSYLCTLFSCSTTVYMSYYANSTLKYAKMDSRGVISIMTIDATSGAGGKGTSITLDANKNPWIAYTTSQGLWVAKNLSGVWTKTLVDSSPSYYAADPSIDVDGNNLGHVSYYDGRVQDLKYAKSQTNGSWVVQTLQSSGAVGEDTSIAVDRNNRPHISFRDITGADLEYIKEVASGGNCGPSLKWSCHTVEATGNVGMDSAIALDPSSDGNTGINISYIDATTLIGGNKLKLATY